MPTITTTPYGQYTHGTPKRTFATYQGGWSRFDAWTPHRPLEAPDAGAGDHVVCLSGSDDTPIYLGTYDATCACCWLHHGHTTAYHDRLVAAHRASVEAHAARNGR